MTLHSAGCDKYYQSIDTSLGDGLVDDEDLDFTDNTLLERIGTPSDSTLNSHSKLIRRNRDKDDSVFGFREEEFQKFVHMLLMKSVQPITQAGLVRSNTEDLILLEEALGARVDNWYGLDNGRFGRLLRHGHVRVGKPEQRTQEVDIYLFEEMIIMTKDKRGSSGATPVTVRGTKFGSCKLKGFILFKNHLTGLRTSEDLVLTMDLSVPELPAVNLYFNDPEDPFALEEWHSAISALAFGQ